MILGETLSETRFVTRENPPFKKTDGAWARSDAQKAETFAQYLVEMFTPVWDQVDNMELLE